MPGRDPKPPGQRRRRNVAPATVKLSAEGSGREAPELPGAGEMLPWTVGYWATIWASPMAAVWIDSDVPALVRLARLQDMAMRDDATAAELSEIRQLEDRFGLSPLARKRLQYEISVASAGAADVKPATVRKLRAV